MALKYPKDLAKEIAKRWAGFQPPTGTPLTTVVCNAPGRHVIMRAAESSLPEPGILEQLIETLYHVSLLTEEGRELAVRISYLTPDDFKGKGKGDQVIHDPPVAFSTARQFTIAEIVRLAPALDPNRSVLVVCPSSRLGHANGSLATWGILHLGEGWCRFISGRESGAMMPPRCLTLSTFSPGNITATIAGRVIARLENGEISENPTHGLITGPVERFLQCGAGRLYQETVSKLGIQKFSQDPDEESLPARSFYRIYENILRFAAEHRHGAAFAIFPDEITADDPRLKALIKMKYAVESPKIWAELVDECVAYRRYFDLVCKKNNVTIAESEQRNVWKRIWESKQQVITSLESFVANLSGVDGIVVLSTGVKLLGFGGEIIAENRELENVMRAEDANATELKAVPANSLGTRHRSAFRLCSKFEECAVLVVSQDGAAKTIKKMGNDVVFWDVDLQPFAL
jgi:hypothetical protein